MQPHRHLYPPAGRFLRLARDAPFAVVPWLCAIVRHMLYLEQALEGVQEGGRHPQEGAAAAAAAATEVAPTATEAASATASASMGATPAQAGAAALPVPGGAGGEGPFAAAVGASTHNITGGAGGLPAAVAGPEGLQLPRPSLAPSVCAEVLASWRSFLVHEVQVSGGGGGGVSAVGSSSCRS